MFSNLFHLNNRILFFRADEIVINTKEYFTKIYCFSKQKKLIMKY